MAEPNIQWSEECYLGFHSVTLNLIELIAKQLWPESIQN